MRVRADRRNVAPRAPAKPDRRDSGYTWNLWHGVFFLLGLGAAALGYALAPRANHPPPVASQHTAPKPGSAMPPWGYLEYTTIQLERPDESFPENVPQPSPILWTFENCDETDLARLLTRPSLGAEPQRQLLDRSNWSRAGNGWDVKPPVEAVRNLSLADRKVIYDVLRRCPTNYFFQHPFRIDASRFEDWLAGSGLRPETQALIRRVVIPEGDQLNFYDNQLLELTSTIEERKRFAKAIARIPALLMSLRITPDSDIEQLARYWGRGGRGKAMKPFLESLRRVTNGVAVSVSYFFPAFARMRLYTYPQVVDFAINAREDCFWTAMNFFNEAPDNRFADAETIRRSLQTEHVQVDTNWTFGDTIMLLQDGKAVHLCVYVADEVVFTKNGADHLEPWVLMKIPDMVKIYGIDKPVKLLGFRRREPAPATP